MTGNAADRVTGASGVDWSLQLLHPCCGFVVGFVGFFAVFGGIKILHEQPGGKVEASDRDDSMMFKVFTLYTCLKIKGLNVYKSFTDCLHM